jgi:hypothetical protein
MIGGPESDAKRIVADTDLELPTRPHCDSLFTRSWFIAPVRQA